MTAAGFQAAFTSFLPGAPAQSAANQQVARDPTAAAVIGDYAKANDLDNGSGK